MSTPLDDAVYLDWITKWRLWKHAWCENDDPLVQHKLCFISRNRNYTSVHHAEIASRIKGPFKVLKIDKNGVVELSSGSATRKAIEIDTIDGDHGIVTLRLILFNRIDVLRLAKIIEQLGHIVLREYSDLVPYKDDPVWELTSG